jgi:hypothetical protein
VFDGRVSAHPANENRITTRRRQRVGHFDHDYARCLAEKIERSFRRQVVFKFGVDGLLCAAYRRRSANSVFNGAAVALTAENLLQENALQPGMKALPADPAAVAAMMMPTSPANAGLKHDFGAPPATLPNSSRSDTVAASISADAPQRELRQACT